MKIDYNFALADFDGNAVLDEKGQTIPAYKAAANIILNSPIGGSDVMKRFRWAQDLYRDQVIDLDKAGQEEFKTAIETAPGVNLLIRGLLLAPLEKS